MNPNPIPTAGLRFSGSRSWRRTPHSLRRVWASGGFRLDPEPYDLNQQGLGPLANGQRFSGRLQLLEFLQVFSGKSTAEPWQK